MKKRKMLLKKLVISSIVLMFFVSAVQISALSTEILNSKESIEPRCIFKKIETLPLQTISEKNNNDQYNAFGVTGTDTWIYESSSSNP